MLKWFIHSIKNTYQSKRFRSWIFLRDDALSDAYTHPLYQTIHRMLNTCIFWRALYVGCVRGVFYLQRRWCKYRKTRSSKKIGRKIVSETLTQFFLISFFFAIFQSKKSTVCWFHKWKNNQYFSFDFNKIKIKLFLFGCEQLYIYI